jgi:ribosomal protein S18 acetylase RimI-like enzyme
MFALSRLSPGELSAFCKMLFSNYPAPEPTAEAGANAAERRLVALGIRLLHVPVGVVSGFHVGNGTGQLRFFYIARKYRRRGLGTRLLEEWEKEMRGLGCTRLEFRYSDGGGNGEWEAWLRKRGWSEPVLYSTVYVIGNCPALAPLYEDQCVPPPFSVVSWDEIAKEKRDQLTSEKAEWIPLKYSPHVYRFDERFSVGLLYHDEVVGWMLLTDVSKPSATIVCMFVRPPFQAVGRARHLMTSVLTRLNKAGFERIKFEVAANNGPMRALVRKRVPPALIETKNFNLMKKQRDV